MLDLICIFSQIVLSKRVIITDLLNIIIILKIYTYNYFLTPSSLPKIEKILLDLISMN